ncbi:MAG TPA: alpha/beta fold hydrolase [Aquabacterium sp.]|uniref:alpha/beta fold hydrolase n=1 Tax=Aquabacterium sp. TaxID=1872578 RepID=UPI002E373058|nr:alpha/beta fold hydrolase [Aquabacterium sp.]HEX5356513.1 alpha/beta fold hydrolase [Aquabacterium sp.]
MDRPLQLGLHHEYADLGDVRLHYVTGGEGPAIVFLHGWPQTWYMWRDVLPGMMQNHRVIAVDMRGLGDSSRPAGGYDTKTVAQDIWRLMHDVLGEKQFFVAAHDWGGPVAYALAAQHRDAVRGMAIFDAPVPGDGTILTALGRWHFGFHGEADLPEALVAGREDLYLRYMFRKGGARPDAVAEEAQREYLRTYTQPGAMRAGFNYYRAMSQDAKDNMAFLKQGKLQMPILVYGGGAANVGRGLFAMDSWQHMADDVRGGVAEGCGHWIPEEKPAWVVERLQDFFATVAKEEAARRNARPLVSTPPAQKGSSMFYETIDTALIDVESMPWIPFTPYSNEILLKLIKVDPIRGEWVTLLKIPGRMELPMHHHAGTVMVWTIAGKWKYLEHDWTGTPGSFVFETAASRHTPVNVGDEEVITLNIVQGDWNIVTPEGAVLAIENWKTMMERYVSYCKQQGITPIDVSSFSA